MTRVCMIGRLGQIPLGPRTRRPVIGHGYPPLILIGVVGRILPADECCMPECLKKEALMVPG
jgi:hypothetical protein